MRNTGLSYLWFFYMQNANACIDLTGDMYAHHRGHSVNLDGGVTVRWDNGKSFVYYKTMSDK